MDPTTKREMEELRATINSPGWKNVIHKTFEARRNNATNLLLSVKRPADQPDDFIRGRIFEVNAIMQSFEAAVRAWDAEVRAETEAAVELEPIGSPYAPDGQPVEQGG